MIESRKPERRIPLDRIPRTHSDEQVSPSAASVREFGFLWPITVNGEAWKIACRQAGLPGKIPHDSRRTAARDMIRSGAPERIAMQLLGHRTRAIFDRDCIVSEADLNTAAARPAAQHAADAEAAATNNVGTTPVPVADLGPERCSRGGAGGGT